MKYEVLIETITDDAIEDCRVIVNTQRGKTHAGLLARNRVAQERGEAYDPARHKVVSIQQKGGRS